MLLELPDVISAEELATLRQGLAAATWSDGRATAGPQAAQVKNNQQASGPELRALQALVLSALERHALLLSAALPKCVLPPMFNRYGGSSNHYGNHIDQAIRQHGEHRVRTDLSCTLFLSDPADYDGGELVLDEGSHESRVKLPAGHMVLYTSNKVHRVEPVTRGERLAAFFWIESLVRSAEQRRLLFDMDMALLRLRERDGDSAETVVLVGTYHNLLRLWADT
jgi:PKHD-type hydroxylase